MIEQLLTEQELAFLIKLLLSFVTGFIIGTERELRGKAAGTSTQCLVIGGAMIFTLLSGIADMNSPARIAAQVVTGVGFLGAGIILKSESGRVTNLTTAAEIWFAAAIGMLIGFGWHSIAVLAMFYAVIVARIPSIKKCQEPR